MSKHTSPVFDSNVSLTCESCGNGSLLDVMDMVHEEILTMSALAPGRTTTRLVFTFPLVSYCCPVAQSSAVDEIAVTVAVQLDEATGVIDHVTEILRIDLVA